jgi:hypothetical protein
MRLINDMHDFDSSRKFYTLWHLPRLPLTEMVGNYLPSFESYDQELLICTDSGHVQVRNQLPPDLLYAESEYAYRTADSFKSTSGILLFQEFLKKVSGTNQFHSIVDIGGNDLALALLVRDCGNYCTVIDPVCSAIDGQTVDDIYVLGQLVENIDLSSDIEPPDLVICRHTLEHFSDPRQVINQCFQQCHPDCLYVVEIPCFESLVEGLRFDAIFHQHYHYFDLKSLKQLIWECGGEYIDHTYNYQGSCGGALLIAFKKASQPQPQPTQIDIENRIAYIERRIKLYTQQMEVMGTLLQQLPEPVYGYGAGLMIATLGYHLKTDFSNLVCVLDDDPPKDGMTYKNVPVKVKFTGNETPPPNSSYIVTSLENIRPIYRRIQDLTPRRVLIPIVC